MALLKDMQKEKPKKRAPRTTKEKTAIAMKIANPTRSMTNIVEQVYNPSTKSSATSIASTLLTKVDMTGWLDKSGLTDEVMAQAIARKALTAKKQNQFTGEIEDDHAIQLKALEFAARLKGLIKAGDTVNNTQNNITVSPILSSLSDVSSDNSDQESTEA